MNRDKKKQIVFIANPFGFGPTGKLFPVMDLLHKNTDHELIFFGDSLSREIIQQDYLEYIEVDERSEESIELALQKLDDPYIISSLNKFAIKAAKNLNFKSVFIDGLTWLWNEIPDDYLHADIYFALNFIGVGEKVKSSDRDNIVQVPYILDVVGLSGENAKRKDFILLHIGGFKNPLYNSKENNYLNILSHILNSAMPDDKIIVAGGSEALRFLESKNKNTEIAFKTYPKNGFQTLMSKCKKLITTSGLTATMEAFYSKTPIHFLLPSNLSQYKIYHLLKDRGLTNASLEWDEHFQNVKEILWNETEADTLRFLDRIARRALRDPTILDGLVKEFQEILSSKSATDYQKDFITQNGINGAEEILKQLNNLWFTNE